MREKDTRFLNRKQDIICVVGPSPLFFSGLTTHTIFLANAFSCCTGTAVLFLRKLLPQRLHPGRNRIGRSDHSLRLSGDIRCFDGMDWYSPATWVQGLGFLKTNKPTYIIIPWWSVAVAHLEILVVLISRLFFGSQVIVEIHEVGDPSETKWSLLRGYSFLAGCLLCRLAQRIIVHTKTVATTVSDIYRVERAKITIIPMGLYDYYNVHLDPELARNTLGVYEEFTILFFGMIKSWKGVDYLVRAFDRLPKRIIERSRLLVVGEVWEGLDNLQSLVLKSANSEKITFTPEFIPDSDVPIYFSCADLVVLPYLRMTGSAVVEIAMAFGKAIVATDIPGMRESLAGYVGAYFVPPKDSESIAQAISQIFEKKIQGGSLSFERTNMTWQVVAERFLSAMKSM